MIKNKNKKQILITNDWTTPDDIWDGLIPFLIPYKDKTIWQPFYCDGKCGKYLSSKGFNIIHKCEDFFEVDYPNTIIVDNPPFNLCWLVRSKREIMKRCMKLNHPFILLFPTTIIQTQYFKEMFDEHFQFIIPPCKYNFFKDGEKTNKCPFYTMWICWKMELKNDINYI